MRSSTIMSYISDDQPIPHNPLVVKSHTVVYEHPYFKTKLAAENVSVEGKTLSNHSFCYGERKGIEYIVDFYSSLFLILLLFFF